MGVGLAGSFLAESWTTHVQGGTSTDLVEIAFSGVSGDTRDQAELGDHGIPPRIWSIHTETQKGCAMGINSNQKNTVKLHRIKGFFQ